MLEGIIPSASSANSAQTPVEAQKTLGKDDFMRLLVAQLSHQNPLEPMNAQDFSAQLAQFSALEQMTNTNANLLKLLDAQQSVTNSSMINLIGKMVDIQGNSIEHTVGETQNLNYSLDERAASAVVEVYDALGQLIATLQGTGAEGNNTALWDGRDNSGNFVSNGNYTFRVSAFDSGGSAVDVKTYTKGNVSEVLFEGEDTFAIVNGNKVSTDNISRVSLN